MKVNGREITLDFEFAEGGLQTPGNEPVKGFFIAGMMRGFIRLML